MTEAEEFEFRARAEQEADATPPASSEPPSSLAVAGNAAARGIAGVGDMFLNAPVNAYNLGKAGAVLAGDAMGNDLRDTLEMTPQPNLVERGFKAAGLIRPENEPQTPGQRILDMAVQAGVGAAVNPAAGLAGVAKGAAMGLASGAAAGAVAEGTGSELWALAAGVAVPLVSRAAVGSKANASILANPTKASTLKESQAVGYVVNPSSIKPSGTTNRLESLAGKAAVKQEAALRNQQVTNSLAAKALGLPAGTPITPQSIQKVRDIAAKPYQEVDALRPTLTMPWFPRYHSTSLLEELKQARADAQQTFTQYNRNADPATLAKAKAFRAEAESLEKDIERVAQAAGKPELLAQLKAGRQLFARTYDVERAMNFADGNVNAQVLGAMAKKGKPFTDELAVIGKFARAFPSLARPGAAVPSSGVSALDAAMAAGLGTAGYYGSGGNAEGAALAVLPLLRGPARAMLLSKGYQNRLLKEPPALNQALLQSILGGRAIADAP